VFGGRPVNRNQEQYGETLKIRGSYEGGIKKKKKKSRGEKGERERGALSFYVKSEGKFGRARGAPSLKMSPRYSVKKFFLFVVLS
jgi:hypothetical protein